MEATETDRPAEEVKDSPTEVPTSLPLGDAMGVVPPDWTGFQAYSPMPPHGYLPSSPQPLPHMWGFQHFTPPYGTTPHPYVMYPHGGLYTHPSMPTGSYPFSPYMMPSPNGVAEASANTPGSMEVNSKSPEGKGKLPIKRSKGSRSSLNTITGKTNESSKSGLSANGSHPKSDEGGSEHTSEGNDDVNSENNSQMKSGSRQDSMEGEASQNGNLNVNGEQNGGLVNQTMVFVPMSATAAGPTSNFNMGEMVAGVTPRESMQPQIWLKDEMEVKRQRRMQSNRESARRSRLRKHAECDELAQCAETLNKENASLITEVSRIKSDYKQLVAENATLKERLGEAPGQVK